MKKIKIRPSNDHPIGCFFITESAISPSSLYGGTWEKLPEGYALWTASSDAGETIAAGLPEVFGWVNTFGEAGFDIFNDAGGAFFKDLTRKTEYQVSVNKKQVEGKSASIGFYASRYDSIYGNSTTVQPPAYKAYVWKRVA